MQLSLFKREYPQGEGVDKGTLGETLPQCPLDYSRQTEWKCFYRKTISKFANYSRKHIIFAVGMMIELLLQ